jgi:hypothetical protein
MERIVNKQPYPFTWLDEVVEHTLNPEKANLQNINSIDLEELGQRLPAEFKRISLCLKNQAFSLYSIDQIKVVAGQYDQAIRLLQAKLKINLAQYPKTGPLHETSQLLLHNLNEFYQSIHQRYQIYGSEYSADNIQPQPFYKVLCYLSVDQIAIILKAADDIKLVVMRSFSQVLKSIVPFLSTERYEDFSWKSARSSTYKMEDRDKTIVIETLEALISKIRQY